jgi:hypothetical protein
MAVSVAVDFRYMPISRQVGFLVIDRSMEQMLPLVSCSVEMAVAVDRISVLCVVFFRV